MQLIFNRRVSRRTPGRFRTRVLTEGVVPTHHVDYKKSKVKQYHKEGQALRTETTINDTYDFDIGRALCNLPALREIGFAANRRLLRVEYLSHNCLIGDDHLDGLTHPVVVNAAPSWSTKRSTGRSRFAIGVARCGGRNCGRRPRPRPSRHQRPASRRHAARRCGSDRESLVPIIRGGGRLSSARSTSNWPRTEERTRR